MEIFYGDHFYEEFWGQNPMINIVSRSLLNEDM
jgi:hypothetical protein